MTLLKGARFALAGSILLYVLVLGLGWAANVFSLSREAEVPLLLGWAAIVGMFVSSIICVVAQIAQLLRRQKEVIGD